MSRIRSEDTKPEIRVRKLLHRMGYRFRLHEDKLPGKPDIVLAKYRTVFEIRGCFWHGHACRSTLKPKTNTHYWNPKIARNMQRDKSNLRKLRRLGWSTHIIWECKLRKMTDDSVMEMLKKRLEISSYH